MGGVTRNDLEQEGVWTWTSGAESSVPGVEGPRKAKWGVPSISHMQSSLLQVTWKAGEPNNNVHLRSGGEDCAAATPDGTLLDRECQAGRYEGPQGFRV